MNQYLLLNRIKIQGANAVAGFTWGFPAITHFLGYTHNLSRKLSNHADFNDITLSGCAVIAHDHQVHTYGRYNELTQSRNPPFLYKKKKTDRDKNITKTPSIMEEGKMDLTVSLLIEYKGEIATRKEGLIQWLKKACQRQRLAGGTILDIADIDFFTIDDEQSKKPFRLLIRKLLPGFVLLDRSTYLEKHFHELQSQAQGAELFDAWLDFIALKQKARPICDLINNHLNKQVESDSEHYQDLLEQWQTHLEQPYSQTTIPEVMKKYFASLTENKANKSLLNQWKNYCSPTEKTDAVWEYMDKPDLGFLVPLMVGYKAISPVYSNSEVANTRDNETDVCFVEAVHSIGEWQGIHRIKSEQELAQTLWRYHYEKNWYLCKQVSEPTQAKETETETETEVITQDSDNEWF